MDPLTILLWLLIILVGGYIALYVLGLLIAVVASIVLLPWRIRHQRKMQRTIQRRRGL